jgi:hypothetical protein
MKTTAANTENKDNARFAFMPEMVLNHLNEAKPTETKTENSNRPEVQKIVITADPEIPNLDAIPISEIIKNKEVKSTKAVAESNFETPKSETEESLITRLINKIKIY